MVISSNAPNDDPLQRLREYATYIEVKFQTGRAYDISIETVEQIIQEVIRLKKNAINGFAKERLTEIENRCYAAIMDYRDSHTRENYFFRLRQISDAIHHLND